ncbi:hypothetical protein [Scytonema sp. HK-05]|uniref:hypothetical protein n=1 Tax=Scytonema sp. HK-05 TaxID=1137095 RepID=UPI0011610FB2|nr:hypothetical protein [Scytonema sp. HK-05]
MTKSSALNEIVKAWLLNILWKWLALTVTSYQLSVISFILRGKHHTNWTESVGGSFKSPKAPALRLVLRLVLF